MKKIHSEYLINENASSLIPVYEMDYQTIVLTTKGKIYVKKTPLEIIKDSCKVDVTSYECRRRVVMDRTSFKNKVPIPINILQGIYALPTSSPRNHDCVWIFLRHIEKVERLDKSKDSNESFQSIVYLLGGTKLPLNVSEITIQNQVYRATVCKNIVESDQGIRGKK